MSLSARLLLVEQEELRVVVLWEMLETPLRYICHLPVQLF